MPLKLDELKSAHWFLTPVPGSFKGHLIGLPCHISDIEKVQLTFYSGHDDKSVTIYDISISDTLPDMQVEGSPLVDKLGQRIDASGKERFIRRKSLLSFYIKSMNGQRQIISR